MSAPKYHHPKPPAKISRPNEKHQVVTLGLSLFVLGFAVGPLLFAPLSEIYGRQILFSTTYFALAAFNAGAAGPQNIQSLLVIRFFAGAFGSSPLTNAGGQIADMFGPDLVGLAMSLFVAAPFIGPALGPIIGGFLAESVGWRWVEGFLAIFTGAMWLLGTLVIPETYAPTLLKKRAQKLSSISGQIYKSKLEMEKGAVDVRKVFTRALGRPWALLCMEPIVLLLAIYASSSDPLKHVSMWPGETFFCFPNTMEGYKQNKEIFLVHRLH